MKKRISILLMIILVLGLTVPAPAGEAVKDDLTAITEQVVTILDIGTDYTDFSGEFTDGIPSRWYLNWTGEKEYLSVTCAKDGTITNVYWGHDNGTLDRFYGYDAAFSSLSSEEAGAQADAWLARLMPEGETTRIDQVSEPKTINDFYFYSGTIFYHGLETPMTFSLSLGPDGIGNYFRNNCRSDYTGDLPGETPAVSEESAAESLYQAVQLELYYMTAKEEARLYYVPVKRSIIVDAMSGETVNMTALYASFDGSNPNNGLYEETAETAAAGDYGSSKRALTEVELSSIDSYTNALPKETLDQTVRTLSALGLSDFTLDRCSYRMDEDDNITAELQYSCEITPDNLFGFSEGTYQQAISWDEQPYVTKYITVDAKTAVLKEVSTYYSLWEERRAAASDPQAAQEFLMAVAPSMADQCAVCTLSGYEQESGVLFSRTQDGYFFPENYLYVALNPATNTVDRYYYIWDDKIVFASSEITVNEKEATALYAGTQPVTLGLCAWPEAIDYNDPVLYQYISWGFHYIESLKLAYFYGGGKEIRGVDAITGEIAETASDQILTYDDLEGMEQKDMILRLAQAGIGFQGGSFSPNRILTMKDAAILLVESAGYYEPDEEEVLKTYAIVQGFLTAEEWVPEQELTLRQFVHMILQPSRYGYTAELPGLWDGEDGYLQIAAALGMLSDQTAIDEPCTRAEAAEILFRFMDRAQLAE